MIKGTIRKQSSTSTIVISLLIVASIPIAIYSIINTNIDTRKYAHEKANYCTIIIPNKNHKTLKVNYEHEVLIYAETNKEEIANIIIVNKTGDEIFSKEYYPAKKSIIETTSYTPSNKGEDKLTGYIKTSQNQYICTLKNEHLFITKENNQPQFLTRPEIDATPNSNILEVGDTYKYTLEANDKDGDRIHFHYSLEPDIEWLKSKTILNGENGNLKIEFQGIAEESTEVEVNFYIHDGYTEHINLQSWTINVAKKSNADVLGINKNNLLVPKVLSMEDNTIIFEEPHISDIKPNEGDIVFNPQPTISTTLIASNKAKINTESIEMLLNSKDISNKINILRVSTERVIITYTPDEPLQNGEQEIKINFKDSQNLNAGKRWTFIIEAEDKGKILFGLPIETIGVVISGVILLILSLSIPWILYIAWKRNTDTEYEEIPIPKTKKKK